MATLAILIHTVDRARGSVAADANARGSGARRKPVADPAAGAAAGRARCDGALVASPSVGRRRLRSLPDQDSRKNARDFSLKTFVYTLTKRRRERCYTP